MPTNASVFEKLDDGRKKASDLKLGDIIKGDGKNDRWTVIGIELNDDSNRVYVRSQDKAGNVNRRYYNYDHLITVYPASAKS